MMILDPNIFQRISNKHSVNLGFIDFSSDGNVILNVKINKEVVVLPVSEKYKIPLYSRFTK